MLIIMVVKMLFMMTIDARQACEEVSEHVMRMVSMIIIMATEKIMTPMTRRMAMMMRAMDYTQAGEVMNVKMMMMMMTVAMMMTTMTKAKMMMMTATDTDSRHRQVRRCRSV